MALVLKELKVPCFTGDHGTLKTMEGEGRLLERSRTMMNKCELGTQAFCDMIYYIYVYVIKIHILVKKNRLKPVRRVNVVF